MGIIKHIMKSIEKAFNTRIVEILFLFVCISILGLCIMGSAEILIESYPAIINSDVLNADNTRVLVSELSEDGTVKLYNGDVIDAKDVKEVYSIPARNEMFYVEDVGLFMPVSYEGVIVNMLSHYILLWVVFILLVIPSMSSCKFKNRSSLFLYGYIVSSAVEYIAYSYAIPAFSPDYNLCYILIILETFTVILRVIILLRINLKSSTPNIV